MSVTYSVFEQGGEVWVARSVMTPEEASTSVMPREGADLPDWLMSAEPGSRFDEDGRDVTSDPDWGTEDIGPRAAEAEPETAVHEAADAHLAEVRGLFAAALAAGRAAVDREALSAAVGRGDSSAAWDAVAGVEEAMVAALGRLPGVLQRIVADGARAGASMAGEEPRAAADVASFVAVDPFAIMWALNHATKLMTGVLGVTLDAIRAAIVGGLAGERTRPEVVEDVLDAIGDEARAETIAHTETMRAANGGLAESWRQAARKGLLPPNARKRWIATGDENMCDECDGVNGEAVLLDQAFSVGQDPPLHPNCRCTMGIAE